MSIRRFIVAFVCIHALVISAFGSDTIIFGLATTSDKATQKQTLGAIKSVVARTQGGTRIQVYDATMQARITDFEVPMTKNVRGRFNRLRSEIASIVGHLGGARSVRAGQGNELDIPGFMTVVGSSVRSQGGTTRVILIGSPFYSTAADPSMRFGPGFYPSDRHPLESSGRTIYGTADRQRLLDGVFVDFALAGTVGTPREQAPVRRFWGLWIDAQGGTMTSFLSTMDVVVERALNGLTDPVVSDELDPNEGRLAMLPIESAPPPIPTPPPVITEPDPIPEDADDMADEIGAAIVIVVDGTSSQTEALPKIRDLLLDVADIGSTAGDLVQLAVVVYRERGSFDRFPLTTIERGAGSRGMAALRRFTDAKSREVSIVTGFSNESGGEKTGESKMVTALEPLISYADFEAGVREGVDLLRAAEADRKIMIIAGDVGTYESDREPQTVSSADLAGEARTRALVRDLAKLEPSARLVTLFTGDGAPFLLHKDRTTSLYRDLAGLFGSRGTYTTEFDDIERIVVRAILDR